MATDKPREAKAELAPGTAGDPPAVVSGWVLVLRIALLLVILPAAIALLAQYVLS